ncbi:MAG TPA: DUF1634 domain-containing protein [Candidatus Angelobacter sp.]
MQVPNRWTDYKLEQIIGNLLRAGVVLSALVVLAGGMMYLIQHGSEAADYRTFHEPAAQLRSIAGTVGEAIKLHSDGIMQLGLLLLILTPIARVVFSALGFSMEGDRMYVGITLVVLAVLVFSLTAAK